MIEKKNAATPPASFRLATPRDYPGLTQLLQTSPDAGQIQIAPFYHLDAYTSFTLQNKDALGVIAEDPETNEIVGAGFISFGTSNVVGGSISYASLKGLVVHPTYRKRGIGAQLASKRLKLARERLGSDGLIIATIQKNNAASLSVAGKWGRPLPSTITGAATKMTRRAPEPLPGIQVKLMDHASIEELQRLTQQANQFFMNHNFYEPETADTLRAWMENSPFDSPFCHYYVATDSAGQFLAGAKIIEQYRLVEMHVKKIPTYIRLLNKILHVVPANGIMKQLMVSSLWFSPGRLREAQYLWETIRWEWRDRASTIVSFYDSRSPVAHVVRLPAWMPRASMSLYVSRPELVSSDRLVHFS